MICPRWRCYLWGMGPRALATAVAGGPDWAIGQSLFFCPLPLSLRAEIFSMLPIGARCLRRCRRRAPRRWVCAASCRPFSFFSFFFDAMALPSSAPLGQGARASRFSLFLLKHFFFLFLLCARTRIWGRCSSALFFFPLSWDAILSASFFFRPRQGEGAQKGARAMRAHAPHPVTTAAMTTMTPRHRQRGRRRRAMPPAPRRCARDAVRRGARDAAPARSR